MNPRLWCPRSVPTQNEFAPGCCPLKTLVSQPFTTTTTSTPIHQHQPTNINQPTHQHQPFELLNMLQVKLGHTWGQRFRTTCMKMDLYNADVHQKTTCKVYQNGPVCWLKDSQRSCVFFSIGTHQHQPTNLPTNPSNFNVNKRPNYLQLYQAPWCLPSSINSRNILSLDTNSTKLYPCDWQKLYIHTTI